VVTILSLYKLYTERSNEDVPSWRLNAVETNLSKKPYELRGLSNKETSEVVNE